MVPRTPVVTSRSSHAPRPCEPRVTFAVPGDLATPTGGFVYDGRIIQELRRLSWKVDVVNIGELFPNPNRDERAKAMAMLASASPGSPTVLDGLAFGALPEAGILRFRTPLIALVHQPLASDPALGTIDANNFHKSESAALASASCVVTTSEATARLLRTEYDVANERIRVVLPGIDRSPEALGSDCSTVRLLSVGSILPVKGYDLLIEALASLTEMSWHLTIAGDRSEASRHRFSSMMILRPVG